MPYCLGNTRTIVQHCASLEIGVTNEQRLVCKLRDSEQLHAALIRVPVPAYLFGSRQQGDALIVAQAGRPHSNLPSHFANDPLFFQLPRLT